ncbi:MAG: condensation domain-containing protein, partial [Thermoanaerobaculia bacterium]
LASCGATVAQATPATWRLLLEAGWEGIPGLRVLCGGEALPRDLAAALLARGVELWNVYGPTETAVWSAAGEVAPGEDPVLLGTPIANTRLHVVDRAFGLVPVGVAGELLIGGAGLARGYLGRPDLTAEKFVPDPFGVPGARIYRTGDLVRRRPSGELEFLGRIDHQVKVRGFRIELGEIEAALLRHPSVSASVVMVREDGGEKRLVGYLVAGAAPSTSELRQALGQSLPEYMIPSAFVTLESLPLTPSGKVDRKALPAPEASAAGEGWVPPQGPVEELLAGIWTEILKVGRVGSRDNFFALGGHSLLATQVVSRIRTALGVELPLQRLFEAPTVAGLAGAVEAARRAGREAKMPPIARLPREGILPLSFAQERMWFLHQLEPRSSAYNLASGARLEGDLDVAVLARCFTELGRRHETLRTVFAEVDGKPVQVIHPAVPFELPLIDLRHLPPAERDAELRRRGLAEGRRPFDLARGPLLRAVLLRMDEREHALLLGMHHVASDGWSMSLLLGELTELYAALAAGRPSPLPELPIQYADFAAWQRSWLSGEELARQVAYWKDQLAGAPPLLE